MAWSQMDRCCRGRARVCLLGVATIDTGGSDLYLLGRCYTRVRAAEVVKNRGAASSCIDDDVLTDKSSFVAPLTYTLLDSVDCTSEGVDMDLLEAHVQQLNKQEKKGEPREASCARPSRRWRCCASRETSRASTWPRPPRVPTSASPPSNQHDMRRLEQHRQRIMHDRIPQNPATCSPGKGTSPGAKPSSGMSSMWGENCCESSGQGSSVTRRAQASGPAGSGVAGNSSESK